jgi:hypothetical protein
MLFMTTPGPGSPPQIFRCTPGGAIAAGRRRVRRLLLGAAVLMLGLGIAVMIAGRWGPAILCGGVAFLCFFAWQMSGDLDPFWLALVPGELTVQMRRQRASLPLNNVTARRLTPQESAHLASLTSAAGVIFASASYESRLLGSFDLHATDLERAVMIETDVPQAERDDDDDDRRRWIITPDDPDQFLEALGSSRRSAP